MTPTDLLGLLQERADPVMYVVTAADGERRAGCLAGFGTQVSIDPPRFLICVSKANHTFRVAARAEGLVVHLLPAAGHDLAVLFGEQTGDDVDKLAAVDWRPGPGGAPVLDRAAAWIGGPVVDRVDLGDHVGMLVEVTEGEGPDAEVDLLRFGHVDDLEPGHPA